MNTMIKAVALAATAIAASSVATTPAFAQRNAPAAAAAPIVATADVDAAIQSTQAFTTAVTQIQTTYAPQIQNRATRAQALQTEMQTLGLAAQTEQARQPQNAAALNAAVTAYRTREAAAQAELQQLSAPIDLAVTYVREQITLQLSAAVQTATTARRVGVLLNSEAVIWRDDSNDLTSAITTELNRLVPNVQIVPPAGYQPGALLRAQAQAAAPVAPVTAPAPTR